MSDRRELLELRRDVLAARSAMLRLRAAGELAAVREALNVRDIAGAMVTSVGARSLGFTALVMLAGPRRVARLVRVAAIAVAVARAVALVRGLATRREA